MVVEIMIVVGAFSAIIVLPTVAMLTTYKHSKMKLQLKIVEQETELERLKMASYEIETEKLRLELQQEKQSLLEMQHKEG